jgi:serine/threonine-protein kinase RsbW
LAENIEKPHGRGIFLMRQLSEEVVFEEPGNKVELTFKV